MMRTTWYLVSLLFAASAASAQQPEGPRFGGPNAVENQVAGDFGDDWDQWKQGLKDDYGLVLNVDYTAVLLTANETFDDDTGAGGIARLFGTFDLFNVEHGTLVWKFEHRHAFGNTSPFDFSLGQIGYVGLQEPPFNDTDFRTQNFYWRQRLNGGRSVLIAGVLDVTDYLDAYALASPWLHFMNFAFSTGSATIGLPNDAAFGVAYGTMLTDNIYLIAGITDSNGDPSRPFDGIGNFFSDNEYFKSVEIGYTSSAERIILDNYHLTVWHKDRQDELNVPEGWGINFSASKFINDKYMPFVRGGLTDDAGSLLESSLSAGVGYRTLAFDGLLGAGVNWGTPNEDTFGPDLDDQFALEVFYRAAAGKHLALTADIQYINNPALNPNESNIWMLNVRARATF
ncbi:MAG: carbohydrate porin [Woeseiaceae bacterium]|nr:carbohydrate porin [Woeseiaceae bacterium]